VPLPPPVELSSWQPLLQAFLCPRLLGGCHHTCLLWPACLFTVHLRDCPSPTLWSWRTLPSLLCVFFLAACLLFSLFFSLFSP
jgi:hypothetical protein